MSIWRPRAWCRNWSNEESDEGRAHNQVPTSRRSGAPQQRPTGQVACAPGRVAVRAALLGAGPQPLRSAPKHGLARHCNATALPGTAEIPPRRRGWALGVVMVSALACGHRTAAPRDRRGCPTGGLKSEDSVGHPSLRVVTVVTPCRVTRTRGRSTLHGSGQPAGPRTRKLGRPSCGAAASQESQLGTSAGSEIRGLRSRWPFCAACGRGHRIDRDDAIRSCACAWRPGLGGVRIPKGAA